MMWEYVFLALLTWNIFFFALLIWWNFWKLCGKKSKTKIFIFPYILYFNFADAAAAVAVLDQVWMGPLPGPRMHLCMHSVCTWYAVCMQSVCSHIQHLGIYFLIPSVCTFIWIQILLFKTTFLQHPPYKCPIENRYMNALCWSYITVLDMVTGYGSRLWVSERNFRCISWIRITLAYSKWTSKK